MSVRRCAVALCLTAGVLTGLLAVSGCQNAPLTGRRQFLAVPQQEEIRLGEDAWREVLAKEQLSSDPAALQLVEKVGRRLAAVSGQPDYRWEFRLVSSDQQNAFCLPGGKVAIYEGILPICENEAGLAVVMSHEIAHALARHGNERMSQQGAVKLGGGMLERVSKDAAAEKQTRWQNAYGVASQYGVLLPYSRTHESEADSIGLMLMAKAGYDPEEAPRFWERFARVSGPKPPEFLSTHPCDAHRASDLKTLLPQALALYRAAPDKIGVGVAIGTPSTARDSSRGIQLADHQSSPGDASGIQQAAFSGEFVPPIQRPRAASTDAGAAPADGPSEAARPFPTEATGDAGWKSSGR